MPALLRGEQVSKYFGGLAAVDHVDFEIKRGEILGLIGPNGAGKTTLLNLISGVYPLSDGEIWFEDRRLDGLKPHQITKLGIGRTFQIVKPFSRMTVKDNVMIGALFGSGEHRVDISSAREKAEEMLEFVGLLEKKDLSAREITVPDRKGLELARVLAMEPKLLLLDETMAGLNPREIEEVMDLICKVNESGITVLVIEHVMKAVMGISHRVFVLHHGKKIATGTPEEVANDERVIKAYLGERYAAARRPAGASPL